MNLPTEAAVRAPAPIQLSPECRRSVKKIQLKRRICLTPRRIANYLQLLAETGLLDFNLQIPANPALFYVLCAIAASTPLQESQRHRVLRRHSLTIEPVAETPAT
jgi:hypothetical protein